MAAAAPRHSTRTSSPAKVKRRRTRSKVLDIDPFYANFWGPPALGPFAMCVPHASLSAPRP